MRIYQIDSWDYSEDHFNLGFDSITLTMWSLRRIDGWISNSCGSSYTENKPMMTYVTLPHTSNTLTVYVYSKFDEASNNESLGFRDIIISIASLASPPTSATFCGVTQGFPLTTNYCGCKSNQYAATAYPTSGICYDCDSTCATCSGAATTCTSCPAGRYLSGSSCLLCNSPCATCSGSATSCTSCISGWYLVGSTCYSTCTAPLYSSVSNGVTYCNTPCPNQYVYWDNSCASTCAHSNAVDRMR